MPRTGTKKIAGWSLNILVAAFLIGPSAIGKFVDWEGKDAMFRHLGFTNELIFRIGVLEILIAILFIIPRTSFIGAILITAYLGGATVTHVRVGDPFFMPIIIGVVLWLSYGLRCPEIFNLALGQTSPRS